MYGKLVRVLVLALAAALVVTLVAVALMKKPDPATQPALTPPASTATAIKKYPHRDMLEDTVAAIPAPVPDAAPVVPAAPVAVPQTAGRSVLQAERLAGTLKLTGAGLDANGRIPRENSCNGQNASPSLQWSGAPRGTRSYAILFEKIDSVEGDAMQWGVYNIPDSQTGLPAALPRRPVLDGGLIQAENDAGGTGYAGPCARRGQHQYRFILIALDKDLSLPAGLKRDDLVRALNGHILDMSVLPLIYFYRL